MGTDVDERMNYMNEYWEKKMLISIQESGSNFLLYRV